MKRLLTHTLFAAVTLAPLHAAFAGAYFGAETGGADQSLVFAGAQTESVLFAAVFVGQLRYAYQDAGKDIDVKSSMVTPTVGYRWSGPVAVSLSIGATWEQKQKRGATTDDSTSTGGFAQLGAVYWRADKNAEFLLSYSAKTEFVWSRVRAKHKITGPWSMGGEVFRMGNPDFDASGAGILAERKWPGFSSTLKAGVNSTSSNDHGVYGGVEFYVPF